MPTPNVYETLRSLEIALPEATKPVGTFVPFVRTGSLLYLSGHIAKKNGQPWAGRSGAGSTLEQGRAAARAVALDLLGTMHGALGDLNRVLRLVKLLVLVNSSPEFTEQHLVANGASELLVQVLGERGLHARSAVGVAQLPFGSFVEIELIAEVE